MFPLDMTALRLMHHIQERLGDATLPVGLALLDYCESNTYILLPIYQHLPTPPVEPSLILD